MPKEKKTVKPKIKKKTPVKRPKKDQINPVKEPKKPSPKKGIPRIKTSAMINNPGGRPSDFDEARDKIIDFIRKGNTYECSCGCSRVSYSTFANWIRQGKEDLENGLLDSKFLKFLKDVEHARDEAEQEVVNMWRECIPGNWQAGKEFLARRNPDKWGSKERVDVTSNGETLGKQIFLPLKDDDTQD